MFFAIVALAAIAFACGSLFGNAQVLAKEPQQGAALGAALDIQIPHVPSGDLTSDRQIDYAALVPLEILQPDRLLVVQHPDFDGLGNGSALPVLAKMARPPGMGLRSIAHEASMYRLLDGLGVTPLFLGHVAEDGRIIGFVTEYVPPTGQKKELGGPERSVAAGGSSSSAESCLAALERMHARGIAHGDAHGENCLVREDGTAVLIDFELSLETLSQAEFERDLEIMRHTTL